MSLNEDLTQHLDQFHTAPFLFVGSGLSRRYLGIEGWEDLLRRFAALTERPYEYYRSSASGAYPGIATEIAKELHSLWWCSPAFEESRSRYSSDARNRESALKIEISRYLESVSIPSQSAAPLIGELDVLPSATIDGIITTNWDLLLEQIFPDFEVYVGQDELLFSASHGVGEMYKIHGCCSKPNSLVITADDYQRFSERNPYLAAKLLTVFVEHPVVFLGYSLNDSTVLNIVQSIALCLTSENIGQLRDRLILVRWDPNEPDYRWEDSTMVVLGFSIPIKTVVISSFLPLFESLAALPRKFPARVLRHLKEHVYELVHDNDPMGRLHVVDIDDDADLSQIKVVYGVGLRVEGREVRFSSELDAQPVRLSNDPSAPVIPFQPPPDDSAYPTLQAELEALVRAWRTDQLAYIAQSRLRAFYSSRLDLELTDESLRCLIISAMHHGAPIHYWASRVGRNSLLPLLHNEINLDLYPRVRYAARLAFAVGLSDGEKMLGEILMGSKHVAVRNLAERLRTQLREAVTIHSEYRSPARSTHLIDNDAVTIDIAKVFENPEVIERALSHLALQQNSRDQARLKQLDAYFYGSRL